MSRKNDFFGGVTVIVWRYRLMFGELNSSPRISYTPALVVFSLILQHAKNGAIILFLLLGEFLYGNILAVWVAGTNAINRNIIWHLLNCADKPYTVQRKIQEEIDRAVGQDRQPTWEDRYRMPYSMAAVWEMLRWRPISPLGLPRRWYYQVLLCGLLYHQ